MRNMVQFPIVVRCPWCEKGETLADKPADINISCQCPRCGRIYLVDFSTLKVEKSAAIRRKRGA